DELRKSASKVAQSVMKIRRPVRAAGHSAASAQQNTVARRSRFAETIVAASDTARAAMAASTIQPYQNMGGPTPAGWRQKSKLPRTGWEVKSGQLSRSKTVYSRGKAEANVMAKT